MEGPLLPPECLIPMLPLLLGLVPGWLGSGSGPGWMYQPGLWQKCMAAARWSRPLKSHPHCATGREDETKGGGGGGALEE